MSQLKLYCFACGGGHRNDNKHFPKKVMEKVKNKEGKEEVRLVGYICRKCVVKDQLREAKNMKQKGPVIIK